jgi:hypothetical protein
LKKNGKVVAVELKTGYPIEFYTKVGNMKNVLSSVRNCHFHYACVQITLGWYLHKSSVDREFEIHDAAVLHLNEVTCTIKHVPGWCRDVLMPDLESRFEKRREVERERKINKKLERERKRLDRERKKVLKEYAKKKK